MNDTIKQYLQEQYGENISISNMEDSNYCFDVFIHDKNINFSVEYKERFMSEKYLLKYDILIELIQSTPFIKKIDVDNLYQYKAHDVNISVGWFYKCNSTRLIFFRYQDGNIFDIIDIDFKLFKGWFMNNLDKFELQYSKKTTGTINAVVKLSDIPRVFFLYNKK